jgi:protein TonB
VLLEDRSARMRGALGVSLVSHVTVPLVLVLLARVLPAVQPAPYLPSLDAPDIIWTAVEGPGGGGGGGGNESLEPPRTVELPGEEPKTVPVAKPVELDVPEVKPESEPEPVPPLELPALAMASGIEALPGVLDGQLPELTLSQGGGRGGGAGTGAGTGVGPGDGSGLGPGWGGGFGGGAYRPGNGVLLPRILREVKPQYTADAMRAKVQGVVELEAVVLADGTVGEVRIVRSLDSIFGLDEEAVKAVRQWRFAPGTRLGQPVAVLVGIELTFTLR